MPAALRLSSLLTPLKALMQLTAEKNLSLVAAGVAFYAILAVFPALAATIALWGLIGDPAQVLTQAEDFKVLIPADIFALIETQLLALAQADGLAQAGVSALIKGLNTIYGAPNRGALRHTATAFLLTLTLIGVALVAIACVVVAPAVLAFIPLGPLAGLGIEIARWAIALTVLLTGFGLVYRIGPNHAGPKPPLLSPGTGFAVLFWMAASVGFSLYLTNFNTYNRVYGSIGAVMAMLMWLYITALLVLLGGALNSRKPST